MKAVGIIPARFASTRFHGKPLVAIKGMTMIQRVYMQAKKAIYLEDVIVATDHDEIYQHVQDFGGKVMMTKEDHISGTDRIAEVAKQLEHFDIVVNIQGDEPYIYPEQIDQLISFLKDNPNFSIATLAKPINDIAILENPNVVKVVFAADGKALYFSRSPVPYTAEFQANKGYYFKHIGMYGFRLSTLLELSNLQKGHLEQLESLEQLRWLENGYSIGVDITNLESISIDTPNDLKRLLKHLSKI